MSGLTPAPKGYPIKLVRDRTPDIVNPTGKPGELFYGPLKGDRHRWLRLKLGEEVTEYLVDGGTDELRDVFIVVVELAHEHGWDLDALVAAARDDPRGLFRDGVMMYGYHQEFDGCDVPTEVETWPIIEHEPEHEPDVPPDLGIDREEP